MVTRYRQECKRGRLMSLLLLLTILSSIVSEAAAEVAMPSRTLSPTPTRTPHWNEVTLCYLPASYISYDRVLARHARFALRRLAPQYSSLNVSLVYIQRNGNPTVVDAAAALLSQGHVCDFFLGPQTSSLSTALSPLISRSWLSHSATSTALAKKTDYPYFSRVIPADDLAGAAMAMTFVRFNWMAASIIASDDSYGLSLTGAFSAVYRSRGGVVDYVGLFLSDENITTVQDIVQRASDSLGPAVMLALPQSARATPLVIRAIVDSGLHRRKVLLLSESLCASYNALLYQLPGALCISYGRDNTSVTSYLDEWLAHSPQELFADFPSMNMPIPADPYAYSILAYFLSDAIQLALTTLSDPTRQTGPRGTSRYTADDNTTTATTGSSRREQVVDGEAGTGRNTVDDELTEAEALFRSLRQTTVTGITGVVQLNSAGDRVGGRLSIRSVTLVPNLPRTNFTLQEIGWWMAGDTAMHFDASVDLTTLPWLAGAADGVPGSYALPTTEDTASTIVGNIVGSSATLLLVLLVVVIVLAVLAVLLYKIGLGESSRLAILLRTGVATRTPLAVGNCVLIVVLLQAAIHAVSPAGRAALPDGLGQSFCAVALWAGISILIEIAVIVRFLFHFVRLPTDEFDPKDAASWRATLALTGAITVVVAKAPIVALASAVVVTSHDADGNRIAVLVLGGVLIGACCDDFPDVVASLRSDARQTQAALAFHVGPVALGVDTPTDEVQAATDFLIRTDVERYRVLQATAKVIAVELASRGVSQTEFFAVVHRFMGQTYAFSSEVGTELQGLNLTSLAAAVEMRSFHHRRPTRRRSSDDASKDGDDDVANTPADIHGHDLVAASDSAMLPLGFGGTFEAEGTPTRVRRGQGRHEAQLAAEVVREGSSTSALRVGALLDSDRSLSAHRGGDRSSSETNPHHHTGRSLLVPAMAAVVDQSGAGHAGPQGDSCHGAVDECASDEEPQEDSPAAPHFRHVDESTANDDDTGL